MLIYGYSRVSTISQSQKETSLEVQEQEIQKYALEKRFVGNHSDQKEVHTFKERAVSGSVPLSKRPRGKNLLAKVQFGDVVVVHRLDRMFRSSADALNMVEIFKEKNVELHILNLGFGNIWGNSVGQLFLTIMSAVAQFDNELRAERIREGKNRKKEKGEFAGGGVPYGYVLKMKEKDGKEVEVLEKDPEQQKSLREMKKLRGEGLSYRKISGQISQKYAKISYEGVRRVLNR